MFKNPVIPSLLFDEGFITEVDNVNGFCKVKTFQGQNLDQVMIPLLSGGLDRGGFRIIPEVGARVKVDFTLGYPILDKILPSDLSPSGQHPMAIATNAATFTGSFAPEGSTVTPDPSKAQDTVSGDIVMSSSGGGIFGVLRSGSILMKSSPLAQIFVSKWKDLVRVVARNFELFTDVASDMWRNVKGRVFHYTGYARTFQEAKEEDYEYHVYRGDTAAGEAAQSDVFNGGSPPELSTKIFKEKIQKRMAPHPNMTRTIDIDGTEESIIIDTRQTQDRKSFTFTHQEKHSIFINGQFIQINFDGISTATFDYDKIDIRHKGASIVLNADGIFADYGGHYVYIDSAGVHTG